MQLAALLKPLRTAGLLKTPIISGHLAAGLAAAPTNIEVQALHYSTRDICAGSLFVAIAGHTTDGHLFVNEAFARGAVAAVVAKPVPNAQGPTFQVADTRCALALLAAEFYGNPSHNLTVIGITGTNGKTTTAFLIEKMLLAAGYRVGVLGTLNCRFADQVRPSPLTTPEAPEIHALLAEMRHSGVTHLVMEISSHALALQRVEALAVDIGVFTNLTQDHLDFHLSMEAYWNTKKQLFHHILNRAPKAGHTTAVINCHDRHGIALRHELSLPVITVGLAPENTISASHAQFSPTGIQARLTTPVGTLEIHSPLAGHHNLENILCAVGVGIALQVPLADMVAALQSVDSVPGRLQRVPDPAGRLIYVDYAHTPDALENALKSLQRLTSRRLICVFGCGGNRDRAKRPQMGAIAARLAHLQILTSDNPRQEDPLQIIRDILAGMPTANLCPKLPEDLNTELFQAGYLIEPDRRRAIRLALTAAGPDDVVLIAGKGHETYQILAHTTLSFDDVEEARQALADDEANRPVRGVLDFNWSLDDVLAATGGTCCYHQAHRPALENGSWAFTGISTDSRRLAPGDLFVALGGEHYDGHRFIDAALKQSAAGVLLSKSTDNTTPAFPQPCIRVSDTLHALGDLAAWQRTRAAARVLALTGSNGKTTTRRMISLVLAQQHYVLATRGNFNNLIGLPLTLLEINYLHEWAVLELGMNRPGEIARLTDICQPEIGIITSIAAAHLEGLTTLEGIMAAKGELLQQMPVTGTAVLNADDACCRQLGAGFKGRVLYFGLSEAADVRARNLRLSGPGMCFELLLPGDQAEIYLNTPGRFMVSNALAAAAAGYLAGLRASQIKTGLESFMPVAGRMQILTTPLGVRLINDTYNANPASMLAAIETLQQVRGNERAVLVLGDMLELGLESARWHQEVGRQAAASHVTRLLVTGRFADDVIAGATRAGLPLSRILTGSHLELLEDLRRFLRAGDWVLVKGSRGMRMERVVDGLLK